MRKIWYRVACSLDGYIAGPNDEQDWIVMDPPIDLQAMLSQYDTVLMGHRSFELFGGGGSPGMRTYVVSRTLRLQDHPGLTIVADAARELLQDLRASPDKDIWLFGGEFFKSLSSWTVSIPLSLPSCLSCLGAAAFLHAGGAEAAFADWA